MMKRLLLPLLLALAAPAAGAAAEARVAALIGAAGNADDDRVRLAHLRALAAAPDIPPELGAEARRLADFAARWVDDPLLEFWGLGVLREGRHDFGVAAASPLAPLADFYLGRMIAWTILEYAGLRNDDARRAAYAERALAGFRAARAAFPGNRIARLYLGEPIPWPKTYPPSGDAPAWAVRQREALDRLLDIVEWWTDRRQRPDGSFGGGWNDDVEMWRWWTPLLIGFEEPKLVAAQTRLAQAVWAQPHMRHGYGEKVTDVEHSNEDATDTLLPMMLLQADRPEWTARARRIVELADTLWLGENRRGGLQFRSYFFGSRAVSPAPEHALDVLPNALALAPALLHWQRTGDPAAGKTLLRWLDTWVGAAARGDNGKPPGVIPAAVRWPDGTAGGGAGHWWRPTPAGNNMVGYYDWPSGSTVLFDGLLIAYRKTGDARYLEPIRATAAVLRRHPAATRPEDFPAGSEPWCAARLRLPTIATHGGFRAVLGRYRQTTGRTDCDDVFPADGAAAETAPAAALDAFLESLRSNFEGYTGEVRFTDRVIRFPEIAGLLRPAGTPMPPVPGADGARRLYESVTGDRGSFSFPQPGVRWLTSARDIAAQVLRCGPGDFAAEIYHFGPAARPLAVLLPLLAPGNYAIRVTGRDGRAVVREERAVDPNVRVPLLLPARELCRIEIVAAPPSGR